LSSAFVDADAITSRLFKTFFPKQIEADIRCRRERASKKLREALRLQATLIEEYRCYVSFPLRSSHSGHEPGEVSHREDDWLKYISK